MIQNIILYTAITDSTVKALVINAEVGQTGKYNVFCQTNALHYGSNKLTTYSKCNISMLSF